VSDVVVEFNGICVCDNAFVTDCRSTLIATVDVSPPERLKEAYNRMEDVKRQSSIAPCGNFSAVYRCMCDYHGVDFMPDVAWVGFMSYYF